MDDIFKRLEQHDSRNYYIETTDDSSYYSVTEFVPRRVNLDDPSRLTKKSLISNSEAISSVGVTYLQKGTLAKIQVVQNKWFNATHQNSTINKEQKKQIIDEYNRLDDMIYLFLNTKLDRNEDGDATLFGFPLGKANLSEGQSILLQFCLAVYCQATELKDLVLFLDEPENHLHPSVLIDVIDRIIECLHDGQIWIATHSLPLLAHFDPSSIWYVEDGLVQYGGRIPEKVLGSLLGSESEIEKLKDFIGLPAQYATSRYAFESLFDPLTLQTDSNDPQTMQIRSELMAISKNEKLKVLDFGAGKGRLISNISELDKKAKEHVIDSVDYVAYDPMNKDMSQCIDSIFKAYGNSNKKYYNDLSNILTDYYKNSFDVIIMCNVLHEIDPNEWLRIFDPVGSLMTLLKEDGVLLLVEDHQVPVGEKAYQKGFLVLDTPQIMELFRISAKDTGFKIHDARNDGRLKAHQIPKNCLLRLDASSRITALKSICSLAQERILGVRGSEKNYKNGKVHGFWVQQFANAQLTLSQLIR